MIKAGIMKMYAIELFYYTLNKRLRPSFLTQKVMTLGKVKFMIC